MGEAKDHDEILRVLPQSERRKAAAAVVDAARPYPAWRIDMVMGSGGQMGQVERLELARQEDLFGLIRGEKDPALRRAMETELAERLGIEAALVVAEANRAGAGNLKDRLEEIASEAAEFASGNFKPGPKLWREQTRALWDWFNDRGGRFFFDMEGRAPFLYYEGEIHDIAVGDQILLGRLWDLAGFNSEDRETKWILAELRAMATARGRWVHQHSWTHTDRKSGAVWINLGAEDGSIIKLVGGKVIIQKNGVNDDQMLLRAPLFSKGFKFVEDAGEDAEALARLGSLVFRNIATARHDALFTVVWALSSFLLGFTSLRPIFHFQGAAGSGKTGAAKLIWTLLYGTDQFQGRFSLAALRSSGARAPFVVKDDISAKEMNESLSQFLKVAATGMGSAKRSSGSEDGITMESSSALIALTGILPFEAPDLRERIYGIIVGKRFQNAGFVESETVGEILEWRERILSAVFRLIAEMLPVMGTERPAVIRWLKGAYPGWSKGRMDEIFSVMVMLARRLAGPMDALPEAWEGTVDEFLFGPVSAEVFVRTGEFAGRKEGCEIGRFIEAQDVMSKSYDRDSSYTLYWMIRLFTHLHRGLEGKSAGSEVLDPLTKLRASMAQEEVEGESLMSVVVDATTNDIHAAIMALAKEFGMRVGEVFSTPMALVKKLESEEAMLAEEDIYWRRNVRKDRRGDRWHRFFWVVESGAGGQKPLL